MPGSFPLPMKNPPRNEPVTGKLLCSLDQGAAVLLRHRWAVYYSVLLAYVLLVVMGLHNIGIQNGLVNLLTPPAPTPAHFIHVNKFELTGKNQFPSPPPGQLVKRSR